MRPAGKAVGPVVAAPPTRWMWAGRAYCQTMLRLGYSSYVHGSVHVPTTGPVILASNHIGYLDGPLLFSVTPRPVHALVKQEMFEGRLGAVLRAVGQIPVERVRVSPAPVKQCLSVLRRGGVVALYPEGRRGAGDVRATKGGAAYLALVSGAPVVPVACLGTRRDGAGTGSSPGRGARLDTVFGAPVRFDPVPWPRTKQHVDDVRTQIQRLLAAHVLAACALTGQTLPALPMTS